MGNAAIEQVMKSEIYQNLVNVTFIISVHDSKIAKEKGMC